MHSFNFSWIRDAGRKAVVYLMLFVMVFNTVACDMGTMDTGLPAELTVSPEPGLHEYTFDGTGGIGNSVQTISAQWTAKDGSISRDVRFDFPNDPGITIKSNEGNGFASFFFTQPGYYIIKASAMYNGQAAITREVHYNVISTLSSLALTTDKDGSTIGQTLRMAVGETVTLIPVFTPSSAGSLGVDWEVAESGGAIATEEVTNAAVADSLTNLKVTAKAEGSTTITAKAKNNEDITKTITVVVSPKMEDMTTEAASVSISAPTDKTIRLGENVKLTATVYDGYNNPVKGQKVTFEIDNQEVFTPYETTDDTITLTAVGGGRSRVSAYFTTKSGERRDASVILNTSGAVERLSITPYFGLVLDGEDETVEVDYYPSDTIEKGYTVSIANPSIVSLSSQNDDFFALKPLKKGQTTVTVTSTRNESLKATATVVVDEELTNIERIVKVEFDSSSVNFPTMTSQKVSAYAYVRNLQGVVDKDATIPLEFTNNDPDVINMTADGPNTITITPRKPTAEGQMATITVRSRDENSFYDELSVTVEGDLVRLVPSVSTVDLMAGGSASYVVEPYPANAIFALSGEENDGSRALVTIDNTNPASLAEAKLTRSGNALKLDVKAGNTPGTSDVRFLKNGQEVGNLSITTTIDSSYVKSIAAERGGARVGSLSLRQDSDPVQVSVVLVNGQDEEISASATAYDFEVSDSRVIDVSRSGGILTISPKNAGESYITLTAASNKEAVAQIYVEVGGSAVQGATFRNFTLSKDSSTLSVDKADTVRYNIIPYSIEDDVEVTVSSSDDQIVQTSHDAINRQVTLVGKKAGSATVTFSARHGDTVKTVTMNVTVNAKNADYWSITLDRDYLSYDLNQRLAQTITATVYKNGQVDNTSKVEWNIEDASIGSITPAGSSNGRSAVVGYKQKTGTTRITASLANNPEITASVVMEVIDSRTVPTTVRNIVMNQSSITLPVGRTTIADYSIVPSALQDSASVTFASDNEAVATVDEAGVVTTHATGSANITATVDMADTGDQLVRAGMRVNVIRDVTRPSYIELSESSLSLSQEKMDEGVAVTATVFDSEDNEVPNAAVNWSQSVTSSRIARFEKGSDNSIIVYPVSAGRATIEARYPGIPTVRLSVTVGEQTSIAKSVERLSANVSDIDMFLDGEAGRTFNVYVTPYPADVTSNLEYEWSSTDEDVVTVTRNADHSDFATITAEGVGKAQVIATIKNTSIRAVIDVSVTRKAPGAVTAIEVSPSTIVFDLNSRELTQIRATVYYNGVVDESQSVTWSVDESLQNGAIAYDKSAVNTSQLFRLAKGTNTGEGFITATSGGKSASTSVEVVESSNEVTLMSLGLSSSSISISAGQKFKVYADSYPSTAASQDGYSLTWSSIDDRIASVDQKGVITGVASGSTQIVATAELGDVTKTAMVSVRVLGEDEGASYITLSDPSITLSQEDMDRAVEVTATVNDHNGNTVPDAEVTWNVSAYAQRIVSTEVDGNTIKVKPVSAGTALITASYPNVPTVDLVVTVGGETSVDTGLQRLVPSTSSLNLWLSETDGQSFNVHVTPVPSNPTTAPEIEWKSGDGTVATVTPSASDPFSATIRARGVGNTRISAKDTVSGIQTWIDVTVTRNAPDGVTAIEVSPSTIVFDLNSRELTQIKATVYYNGKADSSQSVTWTVDESLKDGAITYDTATENTSQYFRIAKGTAKGEGYITATSGGKSAFTHVSTIDSSEAAATLQSIRLSASAISLGVGQKGVVYATPSPTSIADETDYSVKWESDDEDVASVDQNGYITGLADGVATVKATATYNGVSKSASVRVTVSSDIEYPAQLVISPASLRFANSASDAAEVEATILMSSGNEYTLTDGETIEWSADENVVGLTTSENGTIVTITPKAQGSATATARYGTLAANLAIEVGDMVESAATAPTGLSLSSSTGGLMNPPGSATDTTTIISVEYLPGNLASQYKGVEWSLDGDSVARILVSSDHTATLQAVAPGKATVTATSLRDDTVKASIEVTVLDKEILIPRISLDRTNLSMELRDEVKVNATITRNGIDDSTGTVTFSNDSTDPGISFENVGTRGYRITTDTEHTSTFTVTATYPVGVGDNIVSASLPVTVQDSRAVGQPVREVSLSEDSLVMAVGEKKDLDFTVEPKVAVRAEWKSSAPDIVSVDQNGLVEALETGNVEVSVEVTDEFGNKLSDIVTITVTDEIRESSRFSALTSSETSISRTSRDLPYQFTLELVDAEGKVDTVTEITEIKAYGIDGKELNNGEMFTWTKIGKPGRTIELSGFKPGSAYLRFTVLDDPAADGVKAGVSTSVYITISGDVKGLGLDTKYLHMAVGDSEELKLSYSPTTAVPEDGSITWTIIDSKPASGGKEAVVEIVDPTSRNATLKALALGSATVKVSYGTTYSATIEVKVEDIASLSGGISKITFDKSFLELGYPYKRTEAKATVHFYDGTTTSEGVSYSWKDADDSKIATLMFGGTSCYITPVSDGSATLVATYGANSDVKAEMQVFVKGSISELTPSADTMTIYTGGSARIGVTPDITGPSARYGWRIKDEQMTVNGAYSPIGTQPSAFTNIITDPNDDNSVVVVAARSVVTNPDDSRYDKNLVDSYPRKATIEAYLIDNPSVPPSETTVVVELLPAQNLYPTQLQVDFKNITSPALDAYNQVTGKLLDSNGDEVDGHIDWYWYGVGDSGWDESATGSPSDYKTSSWIDPGILNDTEDLMAYTEEDATTIYIKPQKYGIYRLKAICRENPQLQQSVTINIEGEVEEIIDSAGGSMDVTENGDWVSLSATFSPDPVLKRDAFFTLGSFKTGTNGSKAYNEDNNMRFIQNGNTIQVFGKAVTGEPMPLYIEYWDSVTRDELETEMENGTLTRETYQNATKDGDLIASKTVMIRVVPPSKSIASLSVSGLDLSIDPSSITGPINFNVSVRGGNWGSASGSVSGSSEDSSFTNWEWLEVDIIGSDSLNAGNTVIYASTTPDRVNAPASIATGGRINLINGTASFTLVKSAIPNEPLMVRVDLKDDAKDGILGNPDDVVDGTQGTVIFDKEKLGFNKYESLVYIGGQVTNLNPGTTEFTNNGNTTSVSGQVINMITGAMATIRVEYNPSYTHQKGTIWYTPDAGSNTRLNYSYISNGNTNECSIDGASDSLGPVVLRAMSIYDPWFAYRAEQLKKSEESFRAEFLALSHSQRLESTDYRYPNAIDSVQPSIYLDFQVTVSSPIDKAIFTAKAQRNSNPGGYSPSYVYINDPVNHPDVTSTTDIYCYDTSDVTSASSGTSTAVDAYYIEADLEPEYGYSLVFSQVSGSNIGSIDTVTDIDKDDNAFRFIPKGKIENVDGTYSIAYGDVVVRATATAQNFTQDFVLHFLPSSMRVVKYVGEQSTERGVDVPADTWKEEWDVADGTDKQTLLYGMEAIVLQKEAYSLDGRTNLDGVVMSDYDTDDPLEDQRTWFPLTMVEYSSGTPYYAMNGVPTKDQYDNDVINRYGISFAVLNSSDATSGEDISEIAHFETPDGKNLGNSTEILTADDLGGMPYVKVVADKQGVAYLTYSIVPVDENGDRVEGAGTMAGGIMLYVISPMNQLTAAMVGQVASNTKYGLSSTQIVAPLISEKISKAQDHMWFLGPGRDKGGISEPVLTTDGQELMSELMRGRVYASFTYDPAEEDIEGSPLKGGISGGFFGRKGIIVTTMRRISNLELSIDSSNILEAQVKVSGDTEYKGNEPRLSDLVITGPFGLEPVDMVSLTIADQNDGVYSSNIRDGVLDLSCLSSLETYIHTGMGLTNSGDDAISRIVLPGNLKKLDLSKDNLDSEIIWSGSNEHLEEVDLSGNSFKSKTIVLEDCPALVKFTMKNAEPQRVELVDATALTTIDLSASDSLSGTPSRSSVFVTTFSDGNTSAIRTLNAVDTLFTDITVMMMDIPEGETDDRDISIDVSQTLKTGRALWRIGITGGYVGTFSANGNTSLTTIDGSGVDFYGGTSATRFDLTGTENLTTIRVNSFKEDTNLSNTAPSLSEFAFNLVPADVTVTLQDKANLTSLGFDKNGSFAYDVEGTLIIGSAVSHEDERNTSALATVKLGKVNGLVDLNNAKSLSTLYAGVGTDANNKSYAYGTGEISAIGSGLSTFANVSTAVRKLTLDRNWQLSGAVEINGSTGNSHPANEAIEELSMNSCPITSISVTASSRMVTVSAYSCSLTSAEFMGSSLKRVDVHSNRLGGGQLYVGNMRYSNHGFSNGNRDWRSGSNVKYLCAYGNDIYEGMNIDGSWYSFRLGCGIPSGTAIAWRSFDITSEWYKGGGTGFSIGSYSNGGTVGGGWGPMDSRHTYSNSGWVYRNNISQNDGDMTGASANRWAGDYYSAGGSAHYYPFGQ